MVLPMALEIQDSIFIDVPDENERLATDSPEIYVEANSAVIEDNGFNYSSCSSLSESPILEAQENPDIEDAVELSGTLEHHRTLKSRALV